MPHRYDLIAFDFDGTLADSFPVFLDLLDVLADTHGFARVDRGEVDLLRGLDARALLRRQRVPMWKTPRIAMDARRLMAGRIGEVRPFDGIAAMLRGLHAVGLRLAIATSNDAANVRTVLGAELAARMTHLECGASLLGKHVKLRRLLERAGVPAARALYVGDELRDVEAAAAAGMAFAGVAWGYTRPDALRAARPAHWLERPGDLLALVEP